MSDAERLALRIPAPCVCMDTPLCNQHKAAAEIIAAALAECQEAALGLLDAGQRLAESVQAFRNLPMLGRFAELRGTLEYAALCHAWEAWAALEAAPQEREGEP